jgi:hypothetical protein
MPQNKIKTNIYLVLVLKSIGDKSYDPKLYNSAVHHQASFKFPSLDSETERFLWRRKSDLDIIIRSLEKLGKIADLNFFFKHCN